MKRAGPFVGVLALTLTGAAAAVATVAADDPPPAPSVTETVVQTVTFDRKLAGRGVWFWHRRAKMNYREARRLARVLRHDPSVVEAINLACLLYGHCAELWRKAFCETGGTLSSSAYNRQSGASGLLQFLPSTWRSTPFRRFSVWSPYANALAAGWMHRVGRGSEWACG